MGTNTAVKITDAKSGIIRRLIYVSPSGRKVPGRRYQKLMSNIKFELGAIAWYCREVYYNLGIHYYDGYRPITMIEETDPFYNFMESNYLLFKENDGATLKAAYEMYKSYCDEVSLGYKLPRHKFRSEFRNYFSNYCFICRNNCLFMDSE